MTDDIELKPCPFCGGKAKCIEYYGLFHVICCDCYIAGRDRPSIDGAIDAWNTRPFEDALRAENKRLREVLERISDEFEKDEINSFQINRWIYEVLKGTEEK